MAPCVMQTTFWRARFSKKIKQRLGHFPGALSGPGGKNDTAFSYFCPLIIFKQHIPS